MDPQLETCTGEVVEIEEKIALLLRRLAEIDSNALARAEEILRKFRVERACERHFA